MEESIDDEPMEEGMGESPSPPSESMPRVTTDIRTDIYQRLAEAILNPNLKNELDAHFSRLPLSYLVDVTVDRAEDVLLHWNMLAEAKDPTKRPAFCVRFMKLEESGADGGANLPEDDKVISARRDVVPIHEIIFATVDKPKLLSQLSALLSDIGLNIREAHVFSTSDGFSLDVFVVDGWEEKGSFIKPKCC